MFVRVTHMEIATENWIEAMHRFQTKVLSELEQQPGFMRTILTGDATAGKATAITMWQSAAHEQGGRLAQHDLVVEHMAGIVKGDPETSGYPTLFEREF